jgi:malate dehydrogenase
MEIMSRVTVVGAGRYGSTAAQRVAETGLVDEVVMVDVVDGLPQGLALDMNQSRYLERHATRVVGTNRYEDTAGSDVVLITAGLPRRPGMSRMDLLEVNARIMASVTAQVAAVSPEAVLIVVTNPLDHMTMLAAEVSGFPHKRVMGQAGNLDSARFAHFIAEAAGADILDVEAITLGSHGDTMVPVPSLCRVRGRPLTEVLDAEAIAEAIERTRQGGAEIVGLLKTGSAFYAPSSAALKMIRAVVSGHGQVMPVCAWTSGQYGISDIYLGVPAWIGRGGVEEVLELPLTASELEGLRKAAETMRHVAEELHSVNPAPSGP